MGKDAKSASGKRSVVYIILRTLALFFLIAIAVVLVLNVHVGSKVFLAAQRAKLNNEFNEVQTATLSYYTEYSEYPVASDNRTLIGKLEHDSPRQIQFFSSSATDQNDKGEFLDPWHTPIEMSLAEDGTLHLRSAGPDKIVGTADDIANAP